MDCPLILNGFPMNSEMDLNGFPMDFEWVWAPFVSLLGSPLFFYCVPICLLFGPPLCFYWAPVVWYCDPLVFKWVAVRVSIGFPFVFRLMCLPSVSYCVSVGDFALLSLVFFLFPFGVLLFSVALLHSPTGRPFVFYWCPLSSSIVH